MKGSIWLILSITLFHLKCSLSQEEFESTSSPDLNTENMESSTDVNEEGEEGDEDELQSNDPNTIGFYLYPDAENESYYESIRIGDQESLSNSQYSKFKTPIILIHGFVNNFTCKFSQNVKNAFLETGMADKHNIIVLDWGQMSTPKNSTNLGSRPLNDLARNPFYQKAIKNVPRVGKRVSEFVEFLMYSEMLESPSDVYLIGFSLGSHVSGFAGYEVKQSISMPIGRITAVDPAGPHYQTQGLNGRLDASDAQFVDVIHTNQGQSGYEGNCGHADFYPNGGGPNQNDCIGGSSGVEQISGNVAGICAHNRAWVYYIKALQTEVHACKCYATADYWCRVSCPSRILFGYYTPPTARGTYYVDIFAKEDGSINFKSAAPGHTRILNCTWKLVFRLEVSLNRPWTDKVCTFPNRQAGLCE